MPKQNSLNLEIRAWYCPVCRKIDLIEAKEPMAKPEHVPHRGVDIGTCKGIMISLYSDQSLIIKEET